MKAYLKAESIDGEWAIYEITDRGLILRVDDGDMVCSWKDHMAWESIESFCNDGEGPDEEFEFNVLTEEDMFLDQI